MDNPVGTKSAANEFVAFWGGKGYEKGQMQPFWFLRVLGVGTPEAFATKTTESGHVAEFFHRYLALAGGTPP